MKTSIWRFISKSSYSTALLLIVFIFINYLPALDIYLMRDDFEWLQESYRAWQDPSVLFQPINNFFRPLVKLSFLLDFTLFGTDVVYYNVTTIFFHLLNVFLLFLLIYRISEKRYLATLIALAFGTSPLYSEVTLWASGRPDSILLMFMLGVLLRLTGSAEGKKSCWTQWAVLILLTLCAIGSKETWILLPFFAFSFLWILKRVPFKTALKRTAIFFILLILYLGYFIALPIVSGTTAPTSYAGLNVSEMAVKFQHVILRYVGLGGILADETGHFALLLLIIMLLAALAYRLIRVKNWLALWGMVWMLMAIAISLFIRYIPSRYNYLPLLGFWVMVVAGLDHEFKGLAPRFKINAKTLSLAVIMTAVPLLSYNAVMLQWEINDYRAHGQSHRVIVEMYDQVKAQLPRDKPILFVNASKRKSVLEFAQSIRGYRKVLFVREKAIWQLVFISPLANFAGNPFSELLEPIPAEELDTVFQGDFTALVFNDAAFFIADTEVPRLREFYRIHEKLPYKVEAVRFIKTTL